EVVLALEDVAHADPEQRVVVDQQDLDPCVGTAPVGTAPSAVRTLVGHCHLPQLLFAGSSASRTVVPVVAFEMMSNLAPMSWARSRMKRSPKWRFELWSSTSSTGKPRPLSVISRTHCGSFPSLPATGTRNVARRTRVAAACFRALRSDSCATRST